MIVLGWESDEGEGEERAWEGDEPVVHGVMTGYDVPNHGTIPPPLGSVFVPCEGPAEARKLAPELEGTVVWGWLVEDQIDSSSLG